MGRLSGDLAITPVARRGGNRETAPPCNAQRELSKRRAPHRIPYPPPCFGGPAPSCHEVE